MKGRRCGPGATGRRRPMLCPALFVPPATERAGDAHGVAPPGSGVDVSARARSHRQGDMCRCLLPQRCLARSTFGVERPSRRPPSRTFGMRHRQMLRGYGSEGRGDVRTKGQSHKLRREAYTSPGRHGVMYAESQCSRVKSFSKCDPRHEVRVFVDPTCSSSRRRPGTTKPSPIPSLVSQCASHTPVAQGHSNERHEVGHLHHDSRVSP